MCYIYSGDGGDKKARNEMAIKICFKAMNENLNFGKIHGILVFFQILMNVDMLPRIPGPYGYPKH